MKIYHEISIKDFEFGKQANLFADKLTNEEFEQIENQLDFEYCGMIDETELNNLFRFECDYLAQILGYANEKEFNESR